jgi:hypothetical protein
MRWVLVAPHDTTIHSLELDRRFVRWDGQFRWEVAKTNTPFALIGSPLEIGIGPNPPTNGAVAFTVDSQAVFARLSCDQVLCSGDGGPLSPVHLLLEIPAVNLRDEFAPRVAIGESPATDDPIGGVASVPYGAADAGSGIATVGLVVDGSALPPLVADTNEGKCQQPYKFLVPCSLRVDGSLPLDTTAFSNGAHTVEVAAVDASGEETRSAPVTITIRNTPTNNERPLLSGLARVGERLSSTRGKWSGDPSAFSFQWLRCPMDVRLGDESACTAIPGATQSQYVTVAADIGRRAVAKVTAENGFGQESALSAPSDPVAPNDPMAPRNPVAPIEAGKVFVDRTAPILSRVSLSRKRVLVGKARTPLAARTRIGRGTVLRFSSSEAGTLSVTIVRIRARKARAAPLASLTRTISAGPGHLALSGRIGRKRMAAGRYRLRVTVTDAAGNTSDASRLSVRILAR